MVGWAGYGRVAYFARMIFVILGKMHIVAGRAGIRLSIKKGEICRCILLHTEQVVVGTGTAAILIKGGHDGLRPTGITTKNLGIIRIEHIIDKLIRASVTIKTEDISLDIWRSEGAAEAWGEQRKGSRSTIDGNRLTACDGGMLFMAVCAIAAGISLPATGGLRADTIPTDTQRTTAMGRGKIITSEGITAETKEKKNYNCWSIEDLGRSRAPHNFTASPPGYRMYILLHLEQGPHQEP